MTKEVNTDTTPLKCIVLVITLTFDLCHWKPFQQWHSNDEHLWQVSRKSIN